MPFALLIVSPPAAAYAWLVLALCGLLRCAYVPRFVPGLAGGAAGVLATLGYLHAPPDGGALALLAGGVVLLNVEFLRPTFGAALIAGLVAATAGSWRLLAMQPPAAPLPTAAQGALAVGGALVLLVCTQRAVRRYALRP